MMSLETVTFHWSNSLSSSEYHLMVELLLSQRLTWTFDALSILKDKLARFVNLSVKDILTDASPDFASGN